MIELWYLRYIFQSVTEYSQNINMDMLRIVLNSIFSYYVNSTAKKRCHLPWSDWNAGSHDAKQHSTRPYESIPAAAGRDDLRPDIGHPFRLAVRPPDTTEEPDFDRRRMACHTDRTGHGRLKNLGGGVTRWVVLYVKHRGRIDIAHMGRCNFMAGGVSPRPPLRDSAGSFVDWFAGHRQLQGFGAVSISFYLFYPIMHGLVYLPPRSIYRR